jgi:hypothetical protein
MSAPNQADPQPCGQCNHCIRMEKKKNNPESPITSEEVEGLLHDSLMCEYQNRRVQRNLYNTLSGNQSESTDTQV